MIIRIFLSCAALLAAALARAGAAEKSGAWIILSDNEAKAELAIRSAKDFGVGQIQLSHNIIHDLREIRSEKKRALVSRLANLAHSEGIGEVLLWDHCLYPLGYYPDRFKTGPRGAINFDDPEFWEWFKRDYREMLDLAPGADGVVLTFIETGARAEGQHSVKMKTPAEKLAAVVNAVADVVVGERKKRLVIRTFAYSDREYEATVGCIRHIKEPSVTLMVKETPHDFFLTHPDNAFAGKTGRPTIIEFDTGNEYNGQGITASTWPEYVLKRWKNFMKNPNVAGYAARVDRYGDTSIVGTPNEVQLYALKRAAEDPSVDAGAVLDEFIASRYGKAALPRLRGAFSKAFEIAMCSFYTLGTNTADHSALNYMENQWAYTRHVSGRWLNPPTVKVGHGVDRTFHYWKDVINAISPAKYKSPKSPFASEIREVFEKGWLEPGEGMDEFFYGCVMAEKSFGARLAESTLAEVEAAKPHMKPEDFEAVAGLFRRTSLTARLHEAVCEAYYGSRLLARDPEFRTPGLEAGVRGAAERIRLISDEMKTLGRGCPAGQYNWLGDANRAMRHGEAALAAAGLSGKSGGPHGPDGAKNKGEPRP